MQKIRVAGLIKRHITVIILIDIGITVMAPLLKIAKNIRYTHIRIPCRADIITGI